MEKPVITISKTVENLCEACSKCSAELKGFSSKQTWTSQKRSALMDKLSSLVCQSDCAEHIVCSFRPLVLDLLRRAENRLMQDDHLDWIQHQNFAIALSKYVQFSKEALSFASEYIPKNEPFYKTSTDGTNDTRPRKSKKRKKDRPSQEDLAGAVHLFTRFMPDTLRERWDWSEILSLLSSKNVYTRWFASESLIQLVGFSTRMAQVLRSSLFTPEQRVRLSVRTTTCSKLPMADAHLLSNPATLVEEDIQNQTPSVCQLTDSDLSGNVVSVCGILLPRVQHGFSDQQWDQLVPVASTQRNLQSLALAVASGSPVLLRGPVGCGKTALVNHLAQLTGMAAGHDLFTIQLGDQTDSKTLLGTYRCTDVPGEFVWQAGNLTRAVTSGSWVLLEDIDYAPMDVISVLLPLLQNGTLFLPGHGDTITPAPGFRLFATQRLYGSGGALYKQQSAGVEILERMWTILSLEPMTRPELQDVIISRHPEFKTVVDRLLDVYFLLSSGRHGNTEEVKSNVVKFLSKNGRMISTRDLMKWCSRVATFFDVSKTSTADLVFQEALDCFCASLSKSENRIPLAEAIGANLNVSKVKAEFYWKTYKPNIEISHDTFTVGRTSLPKKAVEIAKLKRKRTPAANFAFTRAAVVLLERIAVCVSHNEPVLLVGETGTGKTSSVQYMAEVMGHPLRVINMNQQSDSTDLLGGYKPVDLQHVIGPVCEKFEVIFCKTFSRKRNMKFLNHIQGCLSKRKWVDLLKLLEHSQKMAVKKTDNDLEKHKEWQALGKRLAQLRTQVKQSQSALAFSFIEGSLVSAIRRGEWVLLDEINLAAAETLECLSGLLESSSGSIVLMDRGDTEPIVRHPDFRLFACMNPATDVGKKDLPPGIRNRFTELFVDELEEAGDLRVLVAEYLKGLSLTANQVEGIVNFYLTIRNEAVKKLTDGTGHRPHYSLRTLCRALRQAAKNQSGNVLRSLYEGFCLSFLTELDRSSHPVVEQLIVQHIIGRSNIKSLLKQPIPEPPGNKSIQFEGYWVMKGKLEPRVSEDYILTPSVRANLRDLARVVSAGRHPVLLQGETSVGKTSLITWLAAATGNVCMRINNHEHTDLQEYIGCYAADATGKLVFREGVLVEAMKQGHWIILDELNLAPTDVLEALNRLLDDNRELFIPETGEVVRAHSRFMLFATQNPPGLYGGRKVLSRAFRNRFVELHFDDIPSSELETILHKRCSLPPSYAKRLVAVMLELQTRRRGSGIFAGKQGFITLRDLFRWAERYRQASYKTEEKFFDWNQQLADNGYMLLAGRVRKPEEETVIRKVIAKHLGRSVDPMRLFCKGDKTSPTTQQLLERILGAPPAGFDHVVWTYNMRRMAVLVGQALEFGEPALLVGETGCGKTTVCQLYAELNKTPLYAINCHLHTESADFLGGLRPVRHKQETDTTDSQRLFEWVDGPLVLAMREGAMFLVDEISLADDSVLERLNSVLETERTLVLAEKGGGEHGESEVDIIQAKDSFRVFATMNPGGDYGKKELSPALRNRFTEIWCPQSGERTDLVAVIEHNIRPHIRLSQQTDGGSGFGDSIIDFISWFVTNDFGQRSTVSIRDLLSWVNFINTTAQVNATDNIMEVDEPSTGVALDPAIAFIHGACMVFLDALGSGVTSGWSVPPGKARELCVDYLLRQVKDITGKRLQVSDLGLLTNKDADCETNSVVNTEKVFGVAPFYIRKGEVIGVSPDRYTLTAPVTSMNAQRILRALQLPRPVLLEGSPGVGKTSLVTAIAKVSGHPLVRINLSEQTDISDLFGADLPVEGGEGGEFAWRDGPLLQALRAGHWIVLDELNLASQSVLEGLNACLDHRAEVYIPELGRSFQVQKGKTRFFVCQNPLNQGGGRKGLPRSFLNRFTQVYLEPLSRADLLFITQNVYPTLPRHLLEKMVDFNQKLYAETTVMQRWGHRGGPWEFNLRDIFRWCDLVTQHQVPDDWDIGEYVSLIYAVRMRTEADKNQVHDTYHSVVGTEFRTAYEPTGDLWITTNTIHCGHAILPRYSNISLLGAPSEGHHLRLLHHSLGPLEHLMKVISMNWMAILVGPASSGKTSLVKLLAQLTGHPLHIFPVNNDMDTIELLGGFEQADLSRHLEVVVRQSRQVLHQVVGDLLAANANNFQINASCQETAQHLLAQWNNFFKLIKQQQSVHSSEEVIQLQRKLKVIEDLLEELLRVCKQHILPYEGDVGEQLAEVRKISTQLSKTNSVNQGGQFEWVDSVLVQALRAGHWLLIDNVNFCSPSVLDRLNALLEPQGVLTISERGVIDGQIPTITPHPDFRLILAMDPKYGEISRAMRNRGIEIYILGEDEGGAYDEHDISTLLGAAGVVGKAMSDIIQHIHADIKRHLPFGVQCTVVEQMRVATMTYEHLQHGRSVTYALRGSCSDVYIKGQTDNQIKETLKAVIEKHLEFSDLAKYEIHHKKSSLLHPGHWPEMLPSVRDWSEDVIMASVHQASTLLLHLMDNLLVDTAGQKRSIALSIAELQNGSPKALCVDTPDLLSVAEPIIQLLLEYATLDNWQFLLHWVDHETSLRLSSSSTPNSQQLLVQRLNDSVRVGLEAVFRSELVQKIEETLKEIVPNEEEELDLRQHPIDLRWSSHLVRHLQRCQAKRGNDISQQLDSLNCFANQTVLLSLFSRRWQWFLEDVDTNGEMKALLNLSPLQLSRAFHQGALEVTRLPHPVIVHLEPFVSLLKDAVLHHWCHLHGVPDKTLYTVQEKFVWFERFVSVCRTPVKSSPQESLIPNLALHWSWVTEDILPHLLTPERNQYADLMAVTNHLQATLGVDTAASARHLALWAAVGHPHPYRSNNAAQLAHRLTSLLSLLQTSVKQTLQKSEERRLQCLLQDGPSIASAFLFISYGLLKAGPDDDMDDLEECLTQLELTINQHGLQDQEMSVMQTSDTDFTSAETETVCVRRNDIALWPLHELLSLRTQHWLTSRLVRGEAGPDLWSELSRFIDYGASYVCGSPSYLLPLHSINKEENKVSATRWYTSELLNTLTWRHLTSAATNSPEHWLSWAPATDTEASPIDTPVIKSMYSNMLTHSVMGLLVAPPGDKHSHTSLPGNISLGEMTEKTSQLETLSKTLWTHMATFCSPMWNPSISDCSLVLGSLQGVILALSSCDDSRQEKQNHVGIVLKQLISGDAGLDISPIISQLDMYDVLLPNLADVIKATLSAVQPLLQRSQDPNQSGDMIQNAFENGKAMVHVGLLQSFLLAPQGPVDPAQKKAILLEYAQQELSDIRKELHVRQEWSQITKGRDLDLSSPDLHPRLKWLIQHEHQLQEQIKDLSQDVAIRPQPSQFQLLLKEVGQFLTSIISQERVFELIAKFTNARQTLFDATSGFTAQSLLSEARVWMRTLQEFLCRIQEQYPLYRDITLPFLAGISLLLSGTQRLRYAIEAWSSNSLLLHTLQPEKLSPLVQTVKLLGEYPTVTSARPDLLSLAQELLSTQTLSVLKQLQDMHAKELSIEFTPRVLKLGLHHVTSHALLSGSMEQETMQTLSSLFTMYVTSWQQAEEERRLRAQEQESLYKFRSTTHGDTLTEDQQEEQELRQAFPSFAEDFEDITVGFTLEEKSVEKKAGIHSVPLEEDISVQAWQISEQEMEDVCRAHLALFPALTKTPWMQPPSPLSVSDCLNRHGASSTDMGLSGYKLVTDVCRHAQGMLSCHVDGNLVGAHLLACQALLNSVSQTNETTTNDRPYDVYRDHNVPEVIKCRPLLSTFRTAVDKLLKEWPDHPTLKQMIVVLNRLQNFPVTSPLMKFVTGLEVLLNKAHEWEVNAARHVSLKAESEALTQQIIEWRKHELKCWRTCLDTAAWKCRKKAALWWFHLYQLVESALNPPFIERNTDEMVVEDSNQTEEGVRSIIPALQQFMEESPLGQFTDRLQLIQTFLCQLIHMEPSNRRDELIAVLWNINIYYKQFEPQVSAELTRLRAPIEKELKGFVKIARWNDLNFYSIKQAVEKTHQTLHKHIKAFEQILNRPSRNCLTDIQNDWSSQAEASQNGHLPKDGELQYDVGDYIADEKFKSITTEKSLHIPPRLEVQERLPDLFGKMRHHCRRVLRDLPYHQRITAVNNFTGEIIETTHELQKEIAIQGPNKDKLMKDAKLLQVRKRKALSDLFKHLAQLGLSYRKGMRVMAEADPNAHLLTTPIDIAAMLHQLPPHRCDKEMSSMWSGCQEYVLRCIARRALFRDALKATSPDLSKANIDRCHGFADDLMSLLHNQREELAQMSKSFHEFRLQLGCCERLLADVQRQKDVLNMPQQTNVMKWLVDLKALCVHLLVGLHQVSVILQSCPAQPPEGQKISSPLPQNRLASVANITKQDHAWAEIMKQVKELQMVTESVKIDIDKVTTSQVNLLSCTEVQLIKESLEKLFPLAAILESVEVQFGLPSGDCDNPLTNTLSYLRTEIVSQHESFGAFYIEYNSAMYVDKQRISIDDEQFTAFSEAVGELVIDVLVVVQDLVKQSRKNKVQTENSEEKDGVDEEEDEEKLLEDDHLTVLMHSSLQTRIRGLHLEKIHNKLFGAISLVQEWSESPSMQQFTGSACRVLLDILPILVQYSHLVQGFLTHVIATHRASAKLLSVLLSIFTQLASKGFCLPAELSEEMSGEGATQFEDIEEGGLGEGEGVKDVSDKIENEDQLDEARRPGDEKTEDPGSQPDIAPEDNAIEMDQEFEGKMHDLEPQEGDDDKSEDGDEGDENQIDKQMGDLGDEKADRLDEQIWGDDEEEDKDQPKEDKDEFGPGAGEQTESELVAKDENQDPTQGDDNQKHQEQEEEKETEDGEDKTKEMNDLDEREYDENEVDPYYGDQKPREEPEAMDLPDDLNLDEEDGEQTADDKDGAEGQENPYDIDKITESEEQKAEEEEGGEEKDAGEEDQVEEKKDDSEPKDNPGEDEEMNGDDIPEKEENEEENMDTGEKDEGPPDGEPGLQPQEDPQESHGQEEDEKNKDQTPEETPQAAEVSGKTEHDTQQVQQADHAKDAAGKNEEEQNETEGTGLSEAQTEQGHEGDRTTTITKGGSQQPEQKQASKRKPGQSNAERTVGTEDESVCKRRKTVDRPDVGTEEEDAQQDQQESDLYEHIKDSKSKHDAQTIDAADAEQEKITPAVEKMEEEQAGDQQEEEHIEPDDSEQKEETLDIGKMTVAKLKQSKAEEKKGEGKDSEDGDKEGQKPEVDKEKVDTYSVSRGPATTIHTNMDNYMDTSEKVDIEELRHRLEEELHTWHHSLEASLGSEDAASIRAAQEAWQGYEALTASLSQELCEQLRLVLEPTQASKLRGDYRTGKRLNMRKVIPYIASNFRKDKIWLRRTKPSKRQYQVMVAVDDSSSMADNHSKQLAFESLAVVANALTLLEVGELGISSFGESVKLLHPFHEQFSNIAGARILQQFTFEQKKTKIAQLLRQMTAVMMEARGRQQGAPAETSQLLLIVSDGRGLFLEGMEVVQSAVRQAREANVFIVFVIIDNPDNKDSILDIRVPVFKELGKMPEITSYMDSFPFPFYIILRDINCLPTTLSDALRQWFELVTASDK